MSPVAVVICVVGLALTSLATYATSRVDYNTEQRLLDVQTKQVGAVLSTTVLVIRSTLTTALTVQPMAGSGDASAFRKAVRSSVGPGKLFASASVWRRTGDRMVRLANVGEAPSLKVGSPAQQKYLRAAFGQPEFIVRPITLPQKRRIAYALAAPDSSYVVYAERALPMNRRSPVDSDSAFSGLHYAIYIGSRATPAALVATDVAPSSLPLSDPRATATVPFGNTVLTVVTSPRHHLGSALSRRLPVVLLLGGLFLTAVAAFVGQQFARRRAKAEEATALVTDLYSRVDALYGQERELSVRLQRALLPPVIPHVPNLEVAVEYVAGAHGVDIGGDWYSLIALGTDEFAFVVGDVSGRGIDAVAVMARARFTLRAYLLRGDSPSTALEMCSHQFDITADGHIATTIVGVGNWRTGEITVANAGHPMPLLLTDHSADFVEVATGPPLGTGPTSYGSTTFSLPAGSTLFCFTDGLIERRGEGIDTGMARLAATAGASRGSVDHLVSDTVSALRSTDAEDDIAVLALRWVPES
ncbi:PP2C family serine/threonine-protein phosphatase [Marmoricola sp. OAE513]|uniref:PP2C family protein-serine/threonine phosphatase n=1 Tax=Marmoricola sp. OAE513 TaxID=2817894 RepID=UPI001AE7CD27